MVEVKCDCCGKKRVVCLIYLTHPICESCWEKYAAMETNKLRVKLGLKPMPVVNIQNKEPNEST